MRDNPEIIRKYKIPNADGQIATKCVHFNHSMLKRNYTKDTCSCHSTKEKIVLTDCVILDGQFCDCYTGDKNNV